MSAVAIIPARGGSKRIPRKNIRNFLGKPIIAYSIEAALESKCFEEVMVSTDDEEIASIAKAYGASVPFMRTKKNSDDFASTVDVIIEVLHSYANINKEFVNGCCVYPTAPFVNGPRIAEGFERLRLENCDTVFPICSFGYPIWRGLKVENNKVSMIWPENQLKRSQDLITAYHDAGQWYWFRNDRIIVNRQLWTANTFGVVIPEMEVQDIDTESDWALAEIKYKFTRTNNSI